MKWKRPMAMTGVILILAMYAIAFIAAFFKSPAAADWLTAAIFSTVIVPAVLYAFQLVYRLLNHKDNERNGK